MSELKHISVKKFFRLSDVKASGYINLRQFMKPKPMLGKREANELGNLTYGEVAMLKRNVFKPTYGNLLETFQIVFGIKSTKLLKTDIVSFFYALNWIVKSVKELIEKESKALQSEPDFELEMAGVKRLNVFSELAVLIAIGEKFGKTPEEVEAWKYNLVFSIMLHGKIHNEVQQKYSELKTQNGRT